MNSPTATLEAAAIADGECAMAAGLMNLTGAVREVAPSGRMLFMSDDDLLQTTAAIEAIGRLVDALRLEAAAQIAHRSAGLTSRGDGLAARKGCRNATELIERVTRVSGNTAARRIRLGSESRFPLITEALEAGLLGVDAANAIVAGISPALAHGGIDELKAAEEELVAAAIGTSDLVPTACTADDIRNQAMVWRSYIDPDGVEPVEQRAWRERGFEEGTLKGGLVCGKYALMPEVAAKLRRVFDAYLSPRSGTEFRTEEEQREVDLERDPRSRDQQRHDVIAAMVDHYSSSDVPPRIGGAAPTVLVTVRAEDLESNHGNGYIDGAKAPVSLTTIRHLACNGGYQAITIDDFGSIHGIGSTQRCFTPTQRRAIMARDGGCSVPGCTIPAAWCEIHHVDPAENGGPTHTDNGVLLCWFHHRTIETSGWQFRMIRGAPHVRAPRWIDPDAEWRPTTKSPTMMLDLVERRARRT